MLGAPTEEDAALYEALLALVPPYNDPIAAAIALKGVDPADIPPPPTGPPPTYRPGDVVDFVVLHSDSRDLIDIQAELVHRSRHAYFFVDTLSSAVNATRFPATPEDWRAAGDTFDRAYEAVRAVFGEEASPGIDGDPMLYIVHSDRLGNVGGYFSGPDTLPRAVNEHSNEHEMFFISIQGSTGIASEYYNKTLAHEFQHMVLQNVDPSEVSWLNEGQSELAQQVAGLRGDDWVGEYLTNLDQSLWFWGSEASDYGHAYLFVDYLFERFGTEFITALAANPLDGFAGVDDTLAAMGRNETFDQVYADFLVAAVLNNPSIGDGRFAFRETSGGSPAYTEAFRELPVNYTGEVTQYGLDVFSARLQGQTTLTFTGAQTAMLVPADAHSGRFMWWSTHNDSAFSTLTREVDLSGVDSATLHFATWYHIERHFDYAYVMASTDGGSTWTTLPALTTTDENPLGLNFGHGFTGRSGGEPAWIEETVDLSAYTGETILLRFAMVTDEAYSEPGFLVDDISIPEIGWSDDVEGGEDGWVADGFARIHNRVPQRWLVRAVLLGKNGVASVRDVAVEGGIGTLDLDYNQIDSALLFVSGITRFTTVPAPYQITVTAR